MIMLKPHVYEIPGSWVKYKNALANQIAGFLNFNISKTIGGIKFIFYLHKHRLKQQIDDVILGGCCQTCSAMPKEPNKTLRSQKLKEI